MLGFLSNRIRNILFHNSKILNRNTLSEYSGVVKYTEKEEIKIENANHQIIGTEKIPSWKKDFSKGFQLDESFYTVLDHVIAVGSFGTLVWNKKVVLESVLSSKGYLFRNTNWKGVLKTYFFKPKKEIEWAFSLANCLSNSYFHFVAETLPNLEALIEFEKKNPHIKPKILVAKNAPEFVLEYLQLFGFERDRIIELDESNLLIKKMLVASNRTLKLPLIFSV
jgi:hypothetical protein